jgi:hypothetical protein
MSYHIFMTVYQQMAAYGGGTGAKCFITVCGGDSIKSYHIFMTVYQQMAAYGGGTGAKRSITVSGGDIMSYQYVIR